jgi:hypothetical protein
MPTWKNKRDIAAQCGMALVGLCVLSVMPPRTGAMILIPLAPQFETAVARLAIAHDARLVQIGPLPGSLIVIGDRTELVLPMIRNGILTIGAIGSGCRSRQAGPPGQSEAALI